MKRILHKQDKYKLHLATTNLLTATRTKRYHLTLLSVGNVINVGLF